jgi:hypothetical protein
MGSLRDGPDHRHDPDSHGGGQLGPGGHDGGEIGVSYYANLGSILASPAPSIVVKSVQRTNDFVH